MNRRTLLPLCLCLLLAGCSTVAEHASPSPSASADTPVPTESAAPLPAPEWGEQVYRSSFTVEGRAEPVFAPEYRLPKIENAEGIPAYEAINNYYAAALADLSASAAELSGWAVDDWKTAQAADYSFYEYVDTESYEVTMESATRVSFLRSHYSNSGGPYPALYPQGDTFDLTTGDRLAFADLFTVPTEKAQERVLNAALALNEAGAYSDVVLDADALRASYNPEAFYLTEDSLVCYFLNGDFPQAVGCPTFAVPYTQLEDIWAS